jgi:hypothetical protein
MSERSKPEPKRRRVSREFESFMQEMSEEMDTTSTSEMRAVHPEAATSEAAEIIGDDEKTIRIWPYIGDRIIEDLR